MGKLGNRVAKGIAADAHQRIARLARR